MSQVIFIGGTRNLEEMAKIQRGFIAAGKTAICPNLSLERNGDKIAIEDIMAFCFLCIEAADIAVFYIEGQAGWNIKAELDFCKAVEVPVMIIGKSKDDKEIAKNLIR